METAQIITRLKVLEDKARIIDRNRAYAEEASRQFVRAYELVNDTFHEKERKHEFLVRMLDELKDDTTDLRRGLRRIMDDLEGKGNFPL